MFAARGRVHEVTVEIEHINQLRAGVSLDLTQRWSVCYALAYSLEGSQGLANRGLVEYLSRCGCWALGVEVSQDRNRGVDAKLVYRLVGLSGDPPRAADSMPSRSVAGSASFSR